MRVELHIAPGQQYSGSLKLSNQSGMKTRIRSEALDFDIDDKTTPQFERNIPREEPYSCKKWLSLNPMEIELEKDGFINVRYTLRLPAEVPEGSYNCAAGFTTLPPAEEQSGGVGMRMAVRIVAAIYVVVGNPPVKGALKEIKLEKMPTAKEAPAPAADTPLWQAVVVLENSSKMYYRPTGKLEVLDADGKAVETLDFPSLAVLRERSQRFLFPLKTRLEAGNYKLRVRVDLGAGEVQEGVVDVTVEQPAEARAVAPKSFPPRTP